MYSERHHVSQYDIPLPDAAAATGIPAAAILRYLELGLLQASDTHGQEWISPAQLELLIVLRALELLDQSPQRIRALLESRYDTPTDFDRRLHAEVKVHAAEHAELALLLPQLPGRPLPRRPA